MAAALPPYLLFLLFLLLVILVVLVLAVGAGGDPQSTAVAVLHATVLAAEVNTLALLAALVAALGKVTGAGGELRLDGGVGRDPVGEGVFAVLDDAEKEKRVSDFFYLFFFEL